MPTAETAATAAPRFCIECGVQLPPRTSKNTRICGNACRRNRNVRQCRENHRRAAATRDATSPKPVCAHCGGDIPPNAKKGTQYCHITCRKQAELLRERKQREIALRPKPCALCGSIFKPKRRGQAICDSQECIAATDAERRSARERAATEMAPKRTAPRPGTNPIPDTRENRAACRSLACSVILCALYDACAQHSSKSARDFFSDPTPGSPLATWCDMANLDTQAISEKAKARIALKKPIPRDYTESIDAIRI